MIFLSNMIRKGPDDQSSLVLTPTERSFAYRSEYNQLYHSTSDSALTYLDLTTQYLHTFRGLFLIHKPQIFAYKTKLSEPIDNVLISPKNGEFVYPGEYEELKSLRNKLLNASDNNNINKIKSYQRSIKKKKNYQDKSISNDNPIDYLTKT
ncbi:MAG: hypothetical protein OMM_05825 [Candidatus Magnetoglobus multicellularis str. Araruama]|uniref:Uncharacterized protein n=1 Tax=Candidatus Magnetoglobus multicellularis str. Araruama TaxID=890399 RepID=A0A1V1NTY6_9BACT|nr:MAG: hypothetical protein OMM_05825 [Candidatus Magnetoglobus multicellularis str. Araruama]